MNFLRDMLVCGFTATTAMTIFSYSVSYIRRKNYREPANLAVLIQRWFPRLRYFVSQLVGWFLHYAIGVAFVAAYMLVWHYTAIKPTIVSGLLLGALSGIIGVGIWHLVLKSHPNPPVIDLPGYYGHLLLAHIVFGAIAALAYN